MNSRLVLNLFAIAIISLLFLFLFSAYVPFHMDAFGHYHALMCRNYPLNALNQFTEACGEYDLAPIPGHYLPLRAYPYVGSFHSLIYYPLFKLWPSPYSARFLGLMMLAIQAFLIHKLFRAGVVASFAFLIFCMPYAFQHIVDFGAITFQTTSVFLIYYLTQKWIQALQNNKRHCGMYPFFIGMSLFLGIWTKLSYFALMPGIFVLIIYSFMRESKIFSPAYRGSFKRFIQGALILFLSAGIPSFLLFNAETREYQKYYQEVLDGASRLTLIPNALLIKYLGNPLLSADRILRAGKDMITVHGFLLIIIVAVLLIYGIRKLHIQKANYGFVIINGFLFFLGFYLIAIHPQSWAMHHVVLSLPFLILALLHIYSKLKRNRFISALLIAFLIINISLYYRLTRLEPKVGAHPSFLKINRLLNEQYAAQYVFIIIDWGMYYIKALYGEKNQCVLWKYALRNRGEVKKVKNILDELHRKALFVGRVDSESDLSLIKKNFPDLVRLQTDFDTGKWRIWYEP